MAALIDAGYGAAVQCRIVARKHVITYGRIRETVYVQTAAAICGVAIEEVVPDGRFGIEVNSQTATPATRITAESIIIYERITSFHKKSAAIAGAVVVANLVESEGRFR